MDLLEELTKITKEKAPEPEPISIVIEAIYMLDGSRYKRTVVVESTAEVAGVLTDFQRRFKDLIEIRSNGALIKFHDDGTPYIDWEDTDNKNDNKKPD